MNFLGFPSNLWNLAYLVFPFFLIIFFYHNRLKCSILNFFNDGKTIAMHSGWTFGRVIKYVSLFLFLLFALAALNRPQIEGMSSQKIYQGADVVVVVDISLSMLAEDAISDSNISRLNFAKQKLIIASGKLDDEQIALVIFAGKSFAWIPFLTKDLSTLRFFVDRLSTDLMGERGTDIGVALYSAVQILQESEHEKSNQLILLITDGDVQGNEDIEAFSQAIYEINATDRINLEIIGVGGIAGSLIPIINDANKPDFLVDENGRLARTALREDVLKEIAELAGGNYQKLDGSTSINSLISSERKLIEVKQVRTSKDIYMYYLFAAFLMLGMYLRHD